MMNGRSWASEWELYVAVGQPNVSQKTASNILIPFQKSALGIFIFKRRYLSYWHCRIL